MIEKRFQSTFEEWSEGQRLWCAKRTTHLPHSGMLKFVSSAVWALAGAEIVLPPHWQGIVLLILLAAIQWIVKRRRAAAMRNAYEQDPDRQQPVLVRIDDAGYESFREGLTECRMTWAAFTAWQEGPLTFILGRQAKYCFIPKRVLTPEEVGALRALIGQRVTANG